jgi:low temperature requirement protein LtrA
MTPPPADGTPSPASLLRRRDGPGSARVEMVELFFDLVFVFAVTQLSHGLLADLSPRGAAQTALLLGAVWWVWIYTSWVTNWLDPERNAVRLCLFLLMLGGLWLSVSLPQAFGDKGAVFASAYVAMQVGRTLFFLWAVRSASLAMRRNFQRILVWLLVSGVFWLAGGFSQGSDRVVSWILALALDLASPTLSFVVPGLGRSSTQDWDVDGAHMAERCALFVIIALGESLLVSGSTFAGRPWAADTMAAFGVTFIGVVAMWWLYFDKGAVAGHQRIVHGGDPGRHARLGYTYLHLPIVAGIIVVAVADELVLAHPEHAGPAAIAALLGGPALYLAGLAGFKWSASGRALPPLSHLIGLAALAFLAWPALLHLLSALALAAGATAVLVLVALWENRSLRSGAASPSH